MKQIISDLKRNFIHMVYKLYILQNLNILINQIIINNNVIALLETNNKKITNVYFMYKK